MKCKYNDLIICMKLYIKKLRSDKSILKLNEIIYCIIHSLFLSNKDLYENIYLKLLCLNHLLIIFFKVKNRTTSLIMKNDTK